MLTTNSTMTGEVSLFMAEGNAIYAVVAEAIRNGNPLEDILEPMPDAIYLTSRDGRLEWANSSFLYLFAGSLDRTVKLAPVDITYDPLARMSDEMVVAGCEAIEFQHHSYDARHRAVVLRTMKRSLAECGDPRIAIFGMTRIVEIVDPTGEDPAARLRQQWGCFQELSERDQGVLTGLARGEKLKDIATRMRITEKTVDNRRKSALKTLGLKSQVELIAMFVRFHDRGYGDFGF
ncbi:PAS and helix-turn-helix domain-containing protein [Roseimaritima sediminicola]|uniref:PAS and helix-turn-helix domain-containing protein n=1 Tax=Roseimaritima sediminicola TaxID=2662066 RepID=UPI001386CEA3|nr:PAS and helix-turn-helix domain-containing protein [Roseimaritima sediminicola]